jgi:CysZ protein
MLMCALSALMVAGGAAAGVTWFTAHWVTLQRGWLDTLVTWTAGVLTGIGGWLMLPALTVGIAGFFQERAIARVEQVYYPQADGANALKFWPELWHDLRFTGWALLLNACLLPLYLIGVGFVASILLNSYLLGREFFESAAGRHLGKAEARALGRRNGKAVYGGGLAITVMALAPLLNLFVPILAVVWMVHVFHSLSRTEHHINSQP